MRKKEADGSIIILEVRSKFPTLIKSDNSRVTPEVLPEIHTVSNLTLNDYKNIYSRYIA